MQESLGPGNIQRTAKYVRISKVGSNARLTLIPLISTDAQGAEVDVRVLIIPRLLAFSRFPEPGSAVCNPPWCEREQAQLHYYNNLIILYGLRSV